MSDTPLSAPSDDHVNDSTNGSAMESPDIEVEELAPDGGRPNPRPSTRAKASQPKIAEPPTESAKLETEAEAESEPESESETDIAASADSDSETDVDAVSESDSAADLTAATTAVTVPDDDDEPPPDLCWYVLKVQSGREDSIRDALERRVKIQNLPHFFGPIIVPTEKVAEVRNNRKRIIERKTYPGYLILQMELNEKTWFTIRETPGVGDFVGAHGKPTKMTQEEVDKMLGPQTRPTDDQQPTREQPPKLDVQRGDRVKIKDGPFENFEGNVEEVATARGQVKVILMIFNRPTPVDLEYWQVERV